MVQSSQRDIVIPGGRARSGAQELHEIQAALACCNLHEVFVITVDTMTECPDPLESCKLPLSNSILQELLSEVLAVEEGLIDIVRGLCQMVPKKKFLIAVLWPEFSSLQAAAIKLAGLEHAAMGC